MLKFIARYHTVTTTQVHHWVQPDKHPTQTNRDLAMLRQLKLVQSYPIQLQAGGGRSTLCWQLLRAGAAQLQLPHYGSHFTRRPQPEALQQRDYELGMLRQLKAEGYGWLEPVAYNSQHPKPELTPQARYLREVLGKLEQRRLAEVRRVNPNHFQLEKWTLEYERGFYQIEAPSQANDYLFYREGELVAFVVIACPFDATEHFWKARIKQYQRLAKKLIVVAAFRHEEQAALYKAILKQGGLRPVRFDKVASLAQKLTATPVTGK
jgi:hypothetical protein